MNNIPSLHSLIVKARLLLHSLLPSLSEIDWIDEIRLILTAVLLGSIIVFLVHYLAHNRLATWIADYINATWVANYFNTPRSRSHPSPSPGPICARTKNPDESTRRTVFTDTSVAIYGWPSRGGVIILDDATHVDFTFLGLNTTDPPLKCDRGPDLEDKPDVDAAVLEEDAFCQRLLLLGAKWWDSEARYRFVGRFAGGFEPAIEDVESGWVEEPVLRERRWVRVGWERATASDVRGGDGGLWVLHCDTNMYGILEEDNMVPVDAGRISLARSMAERCEILQMLGARFVPRLEEYDDKSTYLRAWEWKSEGEVGELVKV